MDILGWPVGIFDCVIEQIRERRLKLVLVANDLYLIGQAAEYLTALSSRLYLDLTSIDCLTQKFAEVYL